MKKMELIELKEILKSCAKVKDVSGIRSLAKKNNPIDFAEALNSIEIKKVLFIIRALQTDDAAEIFTYLKTNTQETIIKTFSSDEVKEITEELFTDDIIELFEDIPANLKNKIIKNTSKNKRKDINKILSYEDNTAGSLVATEYIFVYSEFTVRQALNKIKKLSKEKIETFSYIYVTDKKRTLKGVVKLFDLVIANGTTKLSTIINEADIISILDTEDQEVAAKIMKKYDLSTLPVVNKQNKIIGIITVDDILDVVEEEATEDIHKMAAVAPTETQYSKTSVFKLFKSRVIWLLILMITATATQLVIENGIPHKDTIILAGLIPLMMDTAGNAGGQSGAMIIRALSTNDISTRDYLKVVSKEIGVAFFIGLVIFFANLIRMLLMGKTLWTSLMTSTAVFITILIAKILGASLPIFAKKLKLDPAVVAAPLITTVVDLLAIIILFIVYSNFPVL